MSSCGLFSSCNLVVFVYTYICVCMYGMDNMFPFFCTIQWILDDQSSSCCHCWRYFLSISVGHTIDRTSRNIMIFFLPFSNWFSASEKGSIFALLFVYSRLFGFSMIFNMQMWIILEENSYRSSVVHERVFEDSQELLWIQDSTCQLSRRLFYGQPSVTWAKFNKLI
jgi:hypothetical protein